MAYLHEARMMDAVKRLYMLGNRPHREKTEFSGMEAAAGGMTSMGKGIAAKERNRQAAARLQAQKESAEKKQFADDVTFIRGESPNSPVQSDRYRVGEGQALPQLYNPAINAEQAQQLLKNNQQLEEMPIGGRYTPQGLQMAEKDAQLNAMDRMRLKGLIGQGMGLSTPQPVNSTPGAF